MNSNKSLKMNNNLLINLEKMRKNKVNNYIKNN